MKKPAKQVKKTSFKTKAPAVQQDVTVITAEEATGREAAEKAAAAENLRQLREQTQKLPLKDMLSIIQNYLERADSWRDGKRLWDVMAALRGPDEKENYTKAATTTVIRYAAFGYAPRNYGADVYADQPSFAEERKAKWGDPDDATSHFIRHAASAFNALGLKWGELNSR